ncbi:amidohydrolase family protein [Cellulomonas sp. NPDC089187]|uniref:amidohydrolase family protein n=1 Tax=Cellulomonas sp. NPDC089187 TaxID=3154970 RepID=UPI0034209DDA
MRAVHLRGPVVLDDDRVAPEAWLLGDRITFHRPSSVDATLDGWVLPGLVDVHCHVGLGAQGEVDRSTAEQQALADRDSGVLLIRDAGSPADTRWVDDREDLPRLIRAGRHLARPKRYLRHYGRELAEVAELPAAVVQEAVRGDGWVKLVADWIDRDLGPDGDLRPLWPDDVLAQAVAAAHAHGARVTAHTFATEALDGLLDAGVDCLEHATGADPRQIDRIAAAGVPVTVTLLQVAQFAAIADQAVKYPVYAERMRRMHTRRYQHVRDLHDAGIPLLLGTDAGGTIAHGRIADEAAELLAAGIPDADVVAAASWRTRRWLGAPVLGEGDPADLVVYDSDPRVDARVLATPRAVVLRGNRVR